MSWDLPPGTTNKDIDDAAGSGEPFCDGCENEVEEVNDDGLCEECAREHAADMEEEKEKETLE